MTEGAAQQLPELADIFGLLVKWSRDNVFLRNVYLWEYVVSALAVTVLLSLAAYLATRRSSMVPGPMQNAAEAVVEALDGFVCAILGPQGRKFTPFIGTLFLYILCMNLMGLVPFLKSGTASLSTTFTLALCVFGYVQYTAIRQLGIKRYADHLAGRPRGVLAWTVVMPVFMFLLHLVSELLKPVSLSLRLRSNVWGDELLLAVFAGFGIKGLPFLFINMALAVMTAVVQAVVFTLLSTIYFAIFLTEEEEHV